MSQPSLRETQEATTTPRELERLVPSKRRGPTLLLVEDDHEMRRMIARVLRKDGYHVVERADGDSALDWLGDGAQGGYYERLPALIVSDIRLPGLDGFELLEAMRFAIERVPMILITGFPDDETYRRAFELGARNVLEKPFDLEELRAVVWTTLEPEDRARVRPDARPRRPRRPRAGPSGSVRGSAVVVPEVLGEEQPSETHWALDLDFVRGLRRHGCALTRPAQPAPPWPGGCDPAARAAALGAPRGRSTPSRAGRRASRAARGSPAPP